MCSAHSVPHNTQQSVYGTLKGFLQVLTHGGCEGGLSPLRRQFSVQTRAQQLPFILTRCAVPGTLVGPVTAEFYV